VDPETSHGRVSQLQLLAQMLPARAGSVLSIANLKQDLSVAFETADKWVGIFEYLYYCFRIMPYGLPHLRAAKKERKLYLWDWSLCQDDAARFENLVASHLRSTPVVSTLDYPARSTSPLSSKSRREFPRRKRWRPR
jgi:predicted AAA+ superfamily ATPase